MRRPWSNYPPKICRRLGVLALLVYEFIFFAIIVPGHSRGSITLDGKQHGALLSCCCCCCCDSSPADSGAGSKKRPTPEDRKNCAICNLAARVMHTPIFCVVLPKMGLLDIAPPPAPDAFISLELIQTYLSRGPPALA